MRIPHQLSLICIRAMSGLDRARRFRRHLSEHVYFPPRSPSRSLYIAATRTHVRVIGCLVFFCCSRPKTFTVSSISSVTFLSGSEDTAPVAVSHSRPTLTPLSASSTSSRRARWARLEGERVCYHQNVISTANHRTKYLMLCIVV